MFNPLLTEEIHPGALIEIQMGRNRGKAGIVIGAYRSELSNDPLLVVWLEARELDLYVLPETVEIIASHSEILENAPVLLSPEELDALRKIARGQEIRRAWT